MVVNYGSVKVAIICKMKMVEGNDSFRDYCVCNRMYLWVVTMNGPLITLAGVKIAYRFECAEQIERLYVQRFKSI